MSRSRSLLMAVAVAAAAPLAAAESERPAAERYNVRVEYLWWSPQPGGEVQKGYGDRQGTLLDVQADLALQENGANPLRGVLRLGESWKFRGSWSPIDFQGDTVGQRIFSYGNIAVAPGQQVRTSIKGNYATAELEWDGLQRPQGYAGLLFGVKYFDVDTLLLDVDTEHRVTETKRLPVPVLGLTGRVYPHPRLSLEGEFSGLTLGDRGHVWEWLVAGRVQVVRHLAGTVGYRGLKLSGKDERDSLHLDLGAWTFGVELSL